jgi:hypothetical protein
MEVFQADSYTNILNSFRSFSSGLEQIIGMLDKFEVNDSSIESSDYFTADGIDFPDIAIKNKIDIQD